jgi:hypothetical protein
MLSARACPALLAILFVAAPVCGADPPPPPESTRRPANQVARRTDALELRIGVATLRHPFWYEDQGRGAEARLFWDRKEWDRILHGWAQEGYTAVLYWIEPWNRHGWQTFFIRHEQFPEARDLSGEQYSRVIDQVRWIFHRAHELGLKNLLFTYSIVTTPAFARAHKLERLPVSATVDFRHTLKDMGPHYGVRNELTRAFTAAAVAEVFRTYPELDGLHGAMGEAVPGKRSTWYKEAIVPGLKASGRNPLFLVANWMLPLRDFLEDVAPPSVYSNTWLSLHSNAEMFTDAKPYPAYAHWLEASGGRQPAVGGDGRTAVPAVIEVMRTNLENGFPFNSPRLAWQIIHEDRRFENCRGFLAWFSIDDRDHLMRRALAYYAAHPGPYADEPWVRELEGRFGDRQAATHFLNAYNAAARISPDLCALAWVPHDLGTSRILLLPYWYWTEEDPRWSYLASPTRGGVLLPLRHYAKVVARFGPQFRDNNGSDLAKNNEHPGSQELIWGIGDYPITPEAHMRSIRRKGEIALREAEEAMKTVKTNRAEAQTVYNYMKAYKLLTDYYERKVLAATAALIYAFGGGPSYRAEAERRADEAVDAYQLAMNFLWEAVDHKSGNMKGRWLGGKVYTLPELIDREKAERKQLASLFAWPGKDVASPGRSSAKSAAPKAGTYAPEK